MAKFSSRSRTALVGVHPDMVRLMEVAIIDTPFDYTVVEGKREAATQKKYYSWGRTVVNPNTGPKPGKPYGLIVTARDGVKKKSEHQAKADGFGYAVDIYPFFNGSVQTDGAEVIRRLKAITNHIKTVAARLGIAITCGIDWTNPYDPPHVELKSA